MFNKKDDEANRFKIVKASHKMTSETKIIVDTETGVNYLFHGSGYTGGLTILVDREGKPIVTAVERD